MMVSKCVALKQYRKRQRGKLVKVEGTRGKGVGVVRGDIFCCRSQEISVLCRNPLFPSLQPIPSFPLCLHLSGPGRSRKY